MKIVKNISYFILIIVLIGLGLNNIIKEKYFPYKYASYVDKYSREYDLDPLFVLSVIKTESNFIESAESHKNAAGLMQITPETGEWAASKMGYTDFEKNSLYKQEYNIRMGCWYLNYLSDMFNGNTDLMVAAYNAGPSNVKSWLKDTNYSTDGKTLNHIPFEETKNYVKKINSYHKTYTFLYGN